MARNGARPYPKFAALLNDYIKRDDRTATWLATRINVHHSTVNNWLNDGNRPGGPEVIDKIAKALKLEPSEREALLLAADYGDHLFKQMLKQTEQSTEAIWEQFKKPVLDSQLSVEKKDQHEFPTQDGLSHMSESSVIEIKISGNDSHSEDLVVSLIKKLRIHGVNDLVRVTAILLLLTFVLLSLLNGRTIVETLKRLLTAPPRPTPQIIEQTPSSLLTPALTPSVEQSTATRSPVRTPSTQGTAIPPLTPAPFVINPASLPQQTVPGTFTVNGTGQAGTRIEAAINGSENVLRSDVQANGSWEIAIALSQPGQYTIDLTEVSADGVILENSDRFTVTIAALAGMTETLLSQPSLTRTALPTPTPLPPFNVTNTAGKSILATLAFDGDGLLHLVWKDNTLRKGSGFDFLHRVRQSDGTWSDTRNLTQGFDSIQDFLKFVKRPDGVLCLFWDGATVNARPSTIGLYVSCYEDSVWTAAEQLQNDPITATFDPVFAPDGSIHWVYRVPPRFIRVGETDLADGLKNVSLAKMAIDSTGGYHVVWRRDGDPVSVEYRYSNDGGKNWSETERLSDEASPPNSDIWLLADGQGRVHLIWDSGNHYLHYRIWTRESGWQAMDTQTFSGVVRYPQVSLDGNDLLHVIWSDIYEVNYIRQQEDGSWTPPQIIADGKRLEPEPAMGIGADGAKHLVWRIRSDEIDYYYAEIP